MKNATIARRGSPRRLSGVGAIARGLRARRWEIALFAALIALASVLRFWDLGSRTFHGDEAIHAGFAWQLMDGRGYVHNPLTHGPFQFFGTALVFILFGDSDYTARVLPALFGTALVALPFFFRGYLGRPGAFIAALLLAVSPTLLYFSRFAREDIYIAFFMLAMAICIWRYLAQPRRLYLYLIAALLALCFATKEVAYIAVAMLLVYLNLAAAQELAAQILSTRTTGWLPEEPENEGEAPQSHYDVLGLAKDASAREIRHAYTRLTKGGESREGPQRIEHAFKTLSDSWKRQAYDRFMARSPRDDVATDATEEPAAPGLWKRLLVQAALLPTAWLLVAFWPLLSSLRRRLRLIAFPRAGEVLMLIACLALPLYAAAVEKLPFVGDRGATNTASEVLVMHVTVMALIAASFCLGLLWRWRVWTVCAAIFYVIFILLFTSFFTNPNGFWTGTWGSLDYWLSQQPVALGNQPSYYYFMLLPVYEFLPLVFALGAAVFYVLRGKRAHKAVALVALAVVFALALIGEHIPLIGPYRTEIGFVTIIAAMLALPMDALTRFLFYWTLSALFAFTLAGEKMPWLNVHLALPLSILAARVLGTLVSGLEVRMELPPLRRWAPLAGASLAAGSAIVVFVLVGPGRAASSAGWLLLAAVLATVVWSGRRFSPQTAARVAAISLGAMLLVFTMRTSILSSWGHPDLLKNANTLASQDRGDTPVEMLVFVQSSPDIPVVRDAIDKVAEVSGEGVDLPIVIDSRDDYSWPWTWYLRKYEKLTIQDIGDGYQPPAGSVVLVSYQDSKRLKMDPSLFTEGTRYHQRWWFPEDYSGLSSAQVLRELVDTDSWESWRRYFVKKTPPSGIPALDAVAYFPRDVRYSEVLSAALHKQP